MSWLPQKQGKSPGSLPDLVRANKISVGSTLQTNMDCLPLIDIGLEGRGPAAGWGTKCETFA